MPKITNSPFATSFKSAIKRGTPCSVAVNNIANRTGKTTNSIYNSLVKAGCVDRQKFNGQWIYWATNGTKTNSTNWKNAQFNMWQAFCDYCVCNGFCTPENFTKNKGSQKEFMTFCRKFFNKQFNTTTTTGNKKTTGRKRTTTKSNRRIVKSTGRSTTRKSNYKISGRSTSRRAA